jgi:hypothetical protein
MTIGFINSKETGYKDKKVKFKEDMCCDGRIPRIKVRRKGTWCIACGTEWAKGLPKYKKV